MAIIKCEECGEEISDAAKRCPKCGYTSGKMLGKSRTTTALLALLLGGLGAQWFYIGRSTRGLFYILFCWTLIPAILGVIDAIRFFSMSDEDFANNWVKA
jgi:TM2 domain-containing membrane protein YozV